MNVKSAAPTLLLSLCIGFALQGCLKDALDRARQLRTYTNLQAIVGRIEEQRKVAGQVPEDQMVELLKSEGDGRDEWGWPFVCASRRTAEGFSYVVASPGRDGRLDLPELKSYFLAKQESIDGQPDRDIVFLDGLPLRAAGK